MNPRTRKLIQRSLDAFADSIRVYSATDDNTALSDFQREQFKPDSRQIDPAFTRWAYGSPVTGELSYCEKDGKVVGQQGQLNCKLLIDGKKAEGAWAVDLRVSEAWKMRGLGVALIGRLLNNSKFVLGLGISPDAKKMFKRQGWRTIGRVDAFIKPVSRIGLAKVRPGDRPVPSPGKTLAFLMMKLFDRIVLLPDWRLLRKTRVERFDAFDDSFEPLLQAERAAFRVTCSRSLDYLNWRFPECPLPQDYEMYKVSDGEDVSAFAVVCAGHRNGKNALFVQEFAYRNGSGRLLLKFLVAEAYRRKLDVVYYQGLDSRLAGLLRRFLFFFRADGCRFMAYSDDAAMAGILGERKNWRIRLADSDIGFRVQSD